MTRGFDSTHKLYKVINHQRTSTTSDAWIWQPTQPPRDSEMTNELLSQVTRGFDSPHSPLGTQKWPTNCCHGWPMDETAQTATKESEIINELLSRVTRGFESPHGPYWVRNDQRTAVTGNAWIWQPTPPPRDSEMTNELPSRVTRGFDSPHSPLGTQKWPTNCCHWWRVDSTAHTGYTE